jgi:hypothetical protein
MGWVLLIPFSVSGQLQLQDFSLFDTDVVLARGLMRDVVHYLSSSPIYPCNVSILIKSVYAQNFPELIGGHMLESSLTKLVRGHGTLR